MSELEELCCCDDCPEPGSWGIGAHVFSAEGRKIPGEVVFTNVRVCDKCKESLTPGALLNDETWTKIAGKFHMNGKGPDRAKTQLFFEPVAIGACAA